MHRIVKMLFILTVFFTLTSIYTNTAYADTASETGALELRINDPTDGLVVVNNSVTIRGYAINADNVTVNGTKVSVSSNGLFSRSVKLNSVKNQISVIASNAQEQLEETVTVYYSFLPTIEVTNRESGAEVDSPDVILAGDVTPYHQDDIQSFTVNGENTTVSNGEFTSNPIILKEGVNEIKLILKTKAYTLSDGKTVPSREVTKIFKVEYEEESRIDIREPDDEEIIYSNQVTVRGIIREPAGITEIKVGDEVADVDEDGDFKQDITLKSGENEIKITFSDGGKTVTETITVYSNILATDGSEMVFDVKDGQEIKAFTDALKIKLAKGSVGTNTKAIIKVNNGYLAATPPQTSIISPAFHIEWDGDEPIKAYKVTIKYDEIIKDNQASKVTILFYDDRYAEWKTIGGVVDAKNYSVSVDIKSTGTVVAALSYATFGDITGHWAKRDIELLTAKGAIEGRNGGQYFLPDATITRAEFVTCLVKSLGILPYRPITSSYGDVSSTHWAYEYIEAASRAGLVSGVSYGSFAPSRTITREEAAVILTRAGNLKLAATQELAAVLGTFTDSGKISTWARMEVATAVKANVINGNDKKQFLPKNTTTRAQAVSMIARLLENVNKAK